MSLWRLADHQSRRKISDLTVNDAKTLLLALNEFQAALDRQPRDYLLVKDSCHANVTDSRLGKFYEQPVEFAL
jgi:hypothetical protein